MKKVILSINALKAMNFLLHTVLNPKHTVVEAKDVFEGMNVLKRRTAVDVVIIDIDYDTQVNLEFIQHIITSRLYDECKIVVFASKHVLDVKYTELERVGQIYQKPFNPQKLIEYITELPVYQVTP